MPTLKIELILEDVEHMGTEVVVRVRKDGIITDHRAGASPGPNFFPFLETLISELHEMGSTRTAETYRCALNSFRKFRNGRDLRISEISQDLMARYEKYLRGRNLSLNTVSFYMRKMRAAYNRAVDKGFAPDARPFKHVYTGIPGTAKRALSLQDIANIIHLQSRDRHVCFARDMFLFSFYTRGMSFVDMAYLRKTDLRDGWLHYKRHKTGQSIIVRWEKCMQDIVDRYTLPNPVFLLPIIHTLNGKERNQYRNIQNHINRQLKSVARTVGLEGNLTLYVARHSWADIAQQINTPLDVISKGMGHTSEKTTKIYLKSLSLDKIDRVNATIIKMLDVPGGV